MIFHKKRPYETKGWGSMVSLGNFWIFFGFYYSKITKTERFIYEISLLLLNTVLN